MSDFFNPFGYRNDSKMEALQSNLRMVGFCVGKKLVDGVWMADIAQYSNLVNFAIRHGLDEVKLSKADVEKIKEQCLTIVEGNNGNTVAP